MRRAKRKKPAKSPVEPGGGGKRGTRAFDRDRSSPADQGTRERMVAGAARLLAERGLQAASFSEILEATSSPRGSLYHHFPKGKEELVHAALDLVNARMGAAFSPEPGATLEEIAGLFLDSWRNLLERFRFTTGCAVVAVTVATSSPELLDQVGTIFRAWRGRLNDLFVRGGLAPKAAARFAATLIAASEGAVVLSRAEQSLEPFDLVADELLAQARALPKRNSRR